MNAKRLLVLTGLFGMFILSTGCESMSNTAKGGLVGGELGAGLGAAAGGGKGALIGGLAGGLLGGAVGNGMDQDQKRAQQAQLAAAQARPTTIVQQGPTMGIADVIQMTRGGSSEPVIIAQIRNTNSTFQLSMEDVRLLEANNVGQAVIFEMQQRRPQVVVQPVVVQPQGYYYRRPGYYYP